MCFKDYVAYYTAYLCKCQAFFSIFIVNFSKMLNIYSDFKKNGRGAEAPRQNITF
jgi:hypothetical protein